MRPRPFHQKMEGGEKFENIRPSTQFLTLIPNLIILLHKNLVLIRKSENYEQNSSYLAQNLEKTIVLDNKKKREKSDAYFCDPWYDELNEIKYFTPPPKHKN
jgi:hypothetical protein